MAPFPSFMRERNKIWHYRRRVPADLRQYFDNLHEFTKSCHSSKKGDARIMRAQFDQEIDLVMLALRVKVITPEQARRRVDELLGTRKFAETPAPAPYVSAAELVGTGPRLSRVIELFTELKSPGWSTKTATEKLAIFKQIDTRFGRLLPAEIGTSHVLAWRTELLQTLSIVTTNKYMSNLSGLFQFAIDEGRTTTNPARKMQLVDNRIESEIRAAYSETDINVIFRALLTNKERWFKAGRPERFWIPMICMYTGLRADECAQLDVADIDLEEDSLTVSRSTDGDKKAKSKSSLRTLPIHPQLLTLGLGVYVRNMLAAGHTKLFPRLVRHKSNGYAHELIKWWCRWGRALVPDKDKTFHSFRHRVSDMLKQAEVEPKIVSAILGHHEGSLAFGRYGKPYRLAVMGKAMSCLSTELVPTIDQFELKLGQDGKLVGGYRVNGRIKVSLSLKPGQFDIEPGNNIDYQLAYERPDWYGYTFLHQKHLPQLWREPIGFVLVQDVLAQQNTGKTLG